MELIHHEAARPRLLSRPLSPALLVPNEAVR